MESGSIRLVEHRLENGRVVRLIEREVAALGLAEALRRAGFGSDDARGRLPVMLGGLMVGTLPADLDPSAIRSRSDFYDPRPGDLVRSGSRWIASETLGQGDLDAIQGFRRA